MLGTLNRIGQISKAGVIAACALPLVIVALPANSADYLAPAPSQGIVADAGLCSQQSVLRRVVGGFAYQVHHVPHLPQVGISAMSDVRLTRYEPKTNPAQIERTYCQATAVLSDGQHRSVWYLVENGQGYAGVGKNVEFCVDGFDRWNVFNANCRVLR